MFKVGDKVKVIAPGATYDIYRSWMDANAPEYLSKWTSCKIPKKEEIAKVVKPEEEGRYLIETPNSVYIIGERGLEKINSFTKFKIGDIVKIVRDPEGNHRFGDIGVIRNVDNNMFKVSANGEEWWYVEGDLEKETGFPVDFQTGMIVTHRDGVKSIFIKDPCNCYGHKDVFINLAEGHYMELSQYDDNLKAKNYDGKYDIIKVETPEYIGNIFSKEDEGNEILWQRDSAETLKLKAQQRELENKICQTRKELREIQEKLEEVNESN